MGAAASALPWIWRGTKMNSYKVLLVEDELNICNFIKMVFETNGYRFTAAQTGKGGLDKFQTERPDLVVLDLGLPDMDGVDIIKEIRKNSDIPIIVLSARMDEADKVEALDLGVNDYVTKPFGTGELLARVRAAIRNSRFQNAGSHRSNLQLADMMIDFDARKVTIAGNVIRLTQTEYHIVELLAVNTGKVLTYAEIINKIWGYSDSGSVKKLQVNMANIRKKFGEKPGEYHYILNELGVGYRMSDEGESIV